MTAGSDLAQSKIVAHCLRVMVASFIAALVLVPQAQADEGFGGPTFRRGMWRFVRTLEIVTHSNVRQKLIEQEMTRCVDPTVAMKATFSSAPVGNCHSAKPEKVNNRFIFSNRCDYMGPVSTVITVQSEGAYTEVNQLSVGRLPRTDLVVAQRIGDCREDGAALAQSVDLTIEH
ncbi:hypothetical protein [Bradyrhizobium genosp. P]|uniref:hypothetical protein n=1 Tax=Bradyrhizobium genosp. P TaxID=83641 RepID=UPI003CEB5A7B